MIETSYKYKKNISTEEKPININSISISKGGIIAVAAKDLVVILKKP